MLQVLYVGKVRVNQKKISDSFIDDTLDKFRNFELEKERKNALQAAKEEELSSNQVKHIIMCLITLFKMYWNQNLVLFNR